MMTSFVRIIITLSLLRQALGTAQTRLTRCLWDLRFFDAFRHGAGFETIYTEAAVPYLEERSSFDEALARRRRRCGLLCLIRPGKRTLPCSWRFPIGARRRPGKCALYRSCPCLCDQRIKGAFVIGFILYIPFVVIDLVVASVLMSMGMMMLSPMMISCPLSSCCLCSLMAGP